MHWSTLCKVFAMLSSLNFRTQQVEAGLLWIRLLIADILCVGISVVLHRLWSCFWSAKCASTHFLRHRDCNGIPLRRVLFPFLRNVCVSPGYERFWMAYISNPNLNVNLLSRAVLLVLLFSPVGYVSIFLVQKFDSRLVFFYRRNMDQRVKTKSVIAPPRNLKVQMDNILLI